MPLPIYSRPDASQPGWCDTGEAVQPQDSDIATGWPSTQIPPSRQEFNWLDKEQDAAIKYLCRLGIAQYDVHEQYQGIGLAIGSNGSVYWNLRACTGIDPVSDNAGFWELTPIRLRDGDARYLTIINASGIYLTQAEGDARYQLKADMANFLTIVQGDARYAFKTDLAAYLTYVAGDARYAMKGDLAAYLTYAAGDARYASKADLAGYETISHAASTYLRIVDAANIYLSQSAAAQTYLSIADANNRFAATTAEAHSYADNAINNAIAAQRNWTLSMLPGLTMRYEGYSGSTWQASWIVVTASPNNGQVFELCWGNGVCEEGDSITVPTKFPLNQVVFKGWIASALGQYSPGDALLNLVFNFDAPGNYVRDCHYTKSNDGNRPRGRGYAYGNFTAFGWH